MLTHVYRQKDMDFVNVLNNFRVGKVTDEALATLSTSPEPLPQVLCCRVAHRCRGRRWGAVVPAAFGTWLRGKCTLCVRGWRCAGRCGSLLKDGDSDVEPTVLFARNMDVDGINTHRLAQLKENEMR